jgi:hypothetical protein
MEGAGDLGVPDLFTGVYRESDKREREIFPKLRTGPGEYGVLIAGEARR